MKSTFFTRVPRAPWRLTPLPAAALGGITMLALGLHTQADTLTWDGSASSDWNTTETNWNSDGTTLWNNATPDDAIFGATGAGTVTATEAITAGSVTFTGGAYDFAASGGSLSFTTLDTTGATSVGFDGVLAGSGTITSAVGGNWRGDNSAFNGTINHSAGTIDVNGGNNLGTGILNMSGGRLASNNSPTLNSTLVINAYGGSFGGDGPGDTLSISGAFNLLSGGSGVTLVASLTNRQLAFTSSSTIGGDASNVTIGTGTTFIRSGATLNYGGDFTIQRTSPNAAILDLGDGIDLTTNTNNISFNNAGPANNNRVVRVTDGGTATLNNIVQGTTELNGAVQLQTSNSSTLIVAGNITGGGDLTIAGDGSGTTVFTGTNTYAKATNVNAGTLQIGDGGTTGTLGDGNTNLAAGASLAFNRSDTHEYSGQISGGDASSSVVQLGGTLTLSGNNINYLGATNVVGGTLALGNANGLGTGSSTTVAGGATLDLNGQFEVVEPIELNGGALVNTSGTAAIITGGVSGVVVSAGGSGYIEGSPVSLTGGSGTGAAGIITVGVSAASFTIDGGTTTYLAPPTVIIGGGTGATATADLDGSGLVTGVTITDPGSGFAAAPTIAFTGGTVDFAGTDPTGIGNDLNFVLVGIAITDPGSGYTTPPTGISGGGGTGATFTADLTSVTLAADSSIGGGGDLAIDTVVSGANALDKVGAGTLTLSAANTYTGATNVTEGCLIITNAAAIPASGVGTTVSAGAGFGFDPAGLSDSEIATIVGNVNWDPASDLVFTVDSGTQVVSADLSGFGGSAIVLKGTGTLDLSGATVQGGVTYEKPDGGTILEPGGGTQITIDSITTGPGSSSGQKVTIEFTAGGLVDAWASNTLTAGSWSLIKEDISSSPDDVEDDVIATKRFYVLVPAGSGNPFP